MNYEILLREFHQAFNNFLKSSDALDQKFVAGDKVALRRAALITEEAAEVDDALYNGTYEEVLKELCDLLYVTFGTIVNYGMDKSSRLGDTEFRIYRTVSEEAFNRVHANNMLKFKSFTLNDKGKIVKDPKHPEVYLKDLNKFNV